jgi:copper chaperone CopZ
MNVEILYFEGCPSHEPAVELVRTTAAAIGLNPQITQTEISGEEDAVANRFLGSPSIRVDGEDIDPSAHDRVDFGFSCRLYNGQGLPPREMLVAALKGESYARGFITAPESRRPEFLVLGGALLTSILASACCLVPLALLGLGVSAAGFSAAFAPYRPAFLAVTAALLAGGFYFAYFRKAKCAPGAACAVPDPRLKRLTRTGLWVASALVAAFALFPVYAGGLLGARTMEQIRTAAAPRQTRVELAIEGMTCPSCTAHVQETLESVPGVAMAAVDYESASATVVLEDGASVEDIALLNAVEGIGYSATVRTASNPSDSEGENGWGG